jgi:hypothetical protein
MLGQPEKAEAPEWLPSTPGDRTSEGPATGGRVDLTGRRVLVTGASSGIGATTARALVGCGASVAMLARRKERLEELSGELGERAIGVPVDVTDLERLAAAVDEAAAALGGLDGLVAVAGKMMTGSIATGTPERWRELFDLNLLGPLATVRYALPHFPDSGARDVVIVEAGTAGGVRHVAARARPFRGAGRRGHARHVPDRGAHLGGHRVRRRDAPQRLPAVRAGRRTAAARAARRRDHLHDEPARGCGGSRARPPTDGPALPLSGDRESVVSCARARR